MRRRDGKSGGRERTEPYNWAAPFVARHGGKRQIIVSGLTVRSYDFDTGHTAVGSVGPRGEHHPTAGSARRPGVRDERPHSEGHDGRYSLGRARQSDRHRCHRMVDNREAHPRRAGVVGFTADPSTPELPWTAHAATSCAGPRCHSPPPGPRRGFSGRRPLRSRGPRRRRRPRSRTCAATSASSTARAAPSAPMSPRTPSSSSTRSSRTRRRSASTG